MNNRNRVPSSAARTWASPRCSTGSPAARLPSCTISRASRATASWPSAAGRGGEPFEIIDTGGIGLKVDGDFLRPRPRRGGDRAGRGGAGALRRGRPRRADARGRRPRPAAAARGQTVLLVVNKIDEDMHIPLEGEFARLGFTEMHGVSAAHGRGIGELVAAITEQIGRGRGRRRGSGRRRTNRDANAPRAAPRAWSARPNVGKSSLTNAILGQERTIVSDVSGTTRDAVDIPCRFDGKDYVLIDTAGIRHRGKRDNSAEIFSVMRSEESHPARGPVRAGHRRERGHHGAGPADRRVDPEGEQTLHRRRQQVGPPHPAGGFARRRARVPRGMAGQRARRNCSSCRSRRWWRCRRCRASRSAGCSPPSKKRAAPPRRRSAPDRSTACCTPRWNSSRRRCA